MSNSTPHTVQESGGEPQRAAVPSLLVIYARDHARVGHRMAIDGSMAIGRLTTGFGGLPFTDPRMSRDHVQIHVEGDELLLIDGGSTNGTLLNDRPIRQAAMREGDVVQIGTTFFHYGRHAPQPRAVPGSWLTGVDAHSEALRRELSVVAPTGITVLIDGELGSGKRTAARELHRLSGRTGSLITVECAASSSEEVERRLFGDEQEGPVVGPPSAESALLESTDSTLLLADIDRLSVPLRPFDEGSLLHRPAEAGHDNFNSHLFHQQIADGAVDRL